MKSSVTSVTAKGCKACDKKSKKSESSDYLDFDKDGDKEEDMKDAAEVQEGSQKRC